MYNFIRRRIFKTLKKITLGQLTINENGLDYIFGKQDSSYPSVKVIINDPKIYSAVLLEGANGAGSGYVDGYWDCDNLDDLFNIFYINFKLFTEIDTGISRFITRLKSFSHNLKLNSISRAKKNIYKHYDLGNNFFNKFLDKYMMYSCAIFDDKHTTLDSASENKLQIICEKLQLNEKDRVLEIGSGWGGFAIYAATHYGCHVTTTTISKQQFNYVKELISQNNLTDKITPLNLDYRHLEGSFDKIVSIEMIEAVGFQYFPIYFKAVNNLLQKDGKFLLQAIIINDNDYNRAKYEVDFIKKYIFPGGCLPSMEEISRCLNQYTQMKRLDVDDITIHYVKTLKNWHTKFKENVPKITSLGFDSSFIRTWNYYFSYCQAGFEYRHIHNVQLLINKTV